MVRLCMSLWDCVGLLKASRSTTILLFWNASSLPSFPWWVLLTLLPPSSELLLCLMGDIVPVIYLYPRMQCTGLLWSNAPPSFSIPHRQQKASPGLPPLLLSSKRGSALKIHLREMELNLHSSNNKESDWSTANVPEITLCRVCQQTALSAFQPPRKVWHFK